MEMKSRRARIPRRNPALHWYAGGIRAYAEIGARGVVEGDAKAGMDHHGCPPGVRCRPTRALFVTARLALS